VKRILAPFIIFQSICCWLSPAIAVAQPLISRSVTASAYIERGAARFAKGEYERALADFDLAIGADPGHSGAYYNRAITRYRLNDYERDLADFNRAIQLDPRFVEAYVDRSGVRCLMGDLDGAISDSNRAIELNPRLAVERRGRPHEVEGGRHFQLRFFAALRRRDAGHRVE
jgi:tetratricopeptide (TPR) repeat protein